MYTWCHINSDEQGALSGAGK